MTEPAMVATRRRQLAELWDRSTWRVALFLVAGALLGGVGGLIWSAVTPLAQYTINDDLSAGMNERGLAELIAPDVTFSLITAIIGLLVGVVGWFLLHLRGWVVTVMPLAAALCASLAAWQLGVLVGVSGFADRLAAAAPGDLVRVDLELRSMSALLVGPFAAITPVMLLAAFWPERRSDSVAVEPAVTL